MKKAAALVLAFILNFTGTATCFHRARKTEPFKVPETFDESEKIEITFWAKNDTNRTQVDIYEKAISDFESCYPNIKVVLKTYTDYVTIYNDVITNISTGTTPNVCITYPDHIATYITGQNVVVPLDELFEDEKYGFGGSEIKFESPEKEEIVEKFLEECSIGGVHYAIPFMRSTEACYVNKTYAEKLTGEPLPDVLTWEYVWKVSEMAAEKDADGNFKINGQKTMIPFIYKSTDNMMIQMLEQRDAGYSTQSGEILMDSPVMREILYEIAKHVETGAFSTFKKVSYPANFLNAGQCIFAVDSTAGATWMGSEAPLVDISEDSMVQFETAVRMVPQYDPENPEMISQGPSICIFNKENGNEVMASWIFAQFLLTDSVQIAYSQTEGYVPVTKKALNSEEYTDYLSREGEDNSKYYSVKIQASKMLIENTDNTFVTPVFNGSAMLREAAGSMIEDAVMSVSRKIKYDDAHIDKTYNTLIGDIVDSANVKADLGELPSVAKALLISICAIWVCLIAYFIADYIKKRREVKV